MLLHVELPLNDALRDKKGVFLGLLVSHVHKLVFRNVLFTEEILASILITAFEKRSF